MKTIDMLGQPCPGPVIHAKRALADPAVDAVTVLVDNFIAVQNLQKMADGMGYDMNYSEKADASYAVVLQKIGAEATEVKLAGTAPSVQDACGATVLITSDQMGRGSEELGRILIKGFIFALTELDPIPQTVIFVNAGVRLTTDGANTIADLKALREKGVEVYSCGTCLNYYGLTEKLEVGEVVDMLRIVTRLGQAGSVVSI